MRERESSSVADQPKAVKPFLKWAGGKRQIIAELLSSVPGGINAHMYYEPFLGGGSLFFALRPRRAVLADMNEHLIQAYKYVRRCPDKVARYLEKHSAKNSEGYYYETRRIYNRTAEHSAAQAARLIYLNKACFNGIFRVNLKGEFNVPYGQRERPGLPNAADLTAASEALKNAYLDTKPFEEVLLRVGRGDFVYLDPPYPPLNGTSCFSHYTADRFGESDQKKLARFVRVLHYRGCHFMLSNADTKLIRRLYRGFKVTKIPVVRYITCKRVRQKVGELVITNYCMR